LREALAHGIGVLLTKKDGSTKNTLFSSLIGHILKVSEKQSLAKIIAEVKGGIIPPGGVWGSAPRFCL